MPALFVLLWFATGSPGVYEARYFGHPVPAYACAMMAVELKAAWRADGATCTAKPPAGAVVLPGAVPPDRYA